MAKFASFLVGFITGALAGYLVGLLTAPTSGEEARHELGGRAIELRERAEERATRVRENVLGASHPPQEAQPEQTGETTDA